jgi:serine/threonine protein phosphatase 1
VGRDNGEADDAIGGSAAPEIPTGMRIYAVGDIHGRADLLDQLLQLIRREYEELMPARNVIVYLGDYIDRGLDSRGVIETLLSDPLPEFESVYLKGNHEQAVFDFIRDPMFGGAWKYYGGLETLHSYGVKDAILSDKLEAFEAARDHFVELCPPEHLEFLSSLETSATYGDYFFTHAGIRPGVALGRQVEDDLLWIRDEFLSSNFDHGKVVVHGHSPEEQPVTRSNRIGVDTGAYMTGILTALVLERGKQRFLQTDGQEEHFGGSHVE